ncbi:MAG: ABC transporter substrate-binding protein, partial [Bacteroidales bacterium]
MQKKISFCLFPLLLAACSGNNNTHKAEMETYPVTYARGFEVKKTSDYTQVTIRNPWDTTRYLQTYILVDKNRPLPNPMPRGTLIRTPVTQIVTYASPHCGVLNELGEISRVIGVCESRYIDIPYIKKKVETGEIPDLGEASAPDIERLIELQPEVIMTSPFQNMSYGRVAKIGIPLIECADYMESTPLGRAEWIRFHSLFINKEAYADSLFAETVRRYTNLTKRVAASSIRPTIFAERKSGASWFVPGGNSYMAQFYKDAGAHYLWEDNNSSGSIPLSFEEVFDKAATAEFWLLKHNNTEDLTYEQLKQDFNLYS